MISGTRNYEYVNALVRGQIGKLLRPYDYEALLGCNRPSELIQVLRRTTYGDLLESAKSDSFTDIDETVRFVVSQNVTSLIKASPKPARIILNEYRLILESRSIVNSLRSQLNPDDATTSAGAIPLGAVPTTYYSLPLDTLEKEHFKILAESELDHFVPECLQTARSCRSTAPLLRIVIRLCEMFLDRCAKDHSAEATSLERLATSSIDAANLEMIITSQRRGIEPQAVRSWLSTRRGSLPDDSLQAALNLKDIEQSLAQFENSRYRSCLGLKLSVTIDELLLRLPYCIMLQEARSALSGYPFRASTVAAGMALKLIEVRNMRIAIAGVSGRMSRALAFRLIVFP